MIKISLSDFLSFTTQPGTARLSLIRKIKNRKPYKLKVDYWHEVRDSIYDFHADSVLKKDFEEVAQRTSEGSMMNLNDPDPGPRMKVLLQRGFYFEDPKDIELVRSVITQRLHPEAESIDNIGELNKRKYDVEADQAFTQGGESFKKRIRLSRTLLGYSGSDSVRFLQEKTSPPQLPAVNNIALAS